MANQFDIAVPNVLQSLMAGNEAYKQTRDYRKEEELQAARQGAAQDFAAGNHQSALAKLMNIGDTQGMTAIANVFNNQADRDWRRQEADRAQKNQDRSFGLQEKQFQFSTTAKPEIRSIKDASGNETLVRITPDGKAAPVNTGVDAAASNPYSTGKMTDGQANAANYATRMMSAEAILRDPKITEAAQSPWQRGLDWAGSKVGAGAYYNSPEYQKFDQAQRNFINAALRRESGAVISDAEFENAKRQYFPQPGDSKEVLAQKQANRADAIRGIAGGAGAGYAPADILDQSGKIVPNPALKRGQQSSAPIQGARQAPDGKFYVSDPNRPGKYLQVQ